MLLIALKGGLFPHYPKTVQYLSLEEFNNNMKQLESLYNDFISKLNIRGAKMAKIFLKEANSIEDIVSTYNFNINQIDIFLSDLENKIRAFGLDWKDLEASKIKFTNNEMRGDISIDNEEVTLSWKDPDGNAHTLKVNKDGVDNS